MQVCDCESCRIVNPEGLIERFAQGSDVLVGDGTNVMKLDVF